MKQFLKILGLVLIILSFLACPPATDNGDTDEEPATYTLTVNISPGGAGTVARNPNAAEYDEDTAVELTANAKAGYLFDHWEGALSGKNNPETIIMNSNKTVTAVFLDLNGPKYPINININPPGAGDVVKDPDEVDYYQNQQVELTANAAAAYAFGHWEGGLTGSANPDTLIVDATKDVTAFFNKWTIMVYMDGDNNLEGAAIEDFDEMEAVDLTGNGINIIVLIDRIAGYDSSNGDWTNTRLYEIQFDGGLLNGLIESTRLGSTELGLTDTGNEELNMGDPANISNFIDFCKNEYKAANYALIFWNHGSGWRNALEFRSRPKTGTIQKLKRINIDGITNKEGGNSSSGSRYVCVDDTSVDALYTQEFGSATAGEGISIIGFDACLEGMIEVAYEIRNNANYMIGSEDLEPGDGWEYDILLTNFLGTGLAALDFCTSAINAYSTHYGTTSNTTLSAIDLTEIDNVITAFNNFCNELYSDCSNSTVRDNVGLTLWNDAEDFFTIPGDLNIDIWDAADEIETQWDYADAQAQALKTAINAAVVAEWHHNTGNPEAHGIAVHFITLDDGGFPLGHSTAYWKNYNPPVSFPLSFVNNSPWVPVYPSGPGLLFRLWYE